MSSATTGQRKRGEDDLWYVRSAARIEFWNGLKEHRKTCIDDLRRKVSAEAKEARRKAFPGGEYPPPEEFRRIIDRMEEWESRYSGKPVSLNSWAARWNLSQPWLKELAFKEALGLAPDLWVPPDRLARLRDNMGLPPSFKFEASWDPLRPWFNEAKEPEGKSAARKRIIGQFQAMLTAYLHRVESFRKTGPPGLEEYLAAMSIMPEDFRWLVKRVVPIRPGDKPITAEQIANDESTSDVSGGPRIQTIYQRTVPLAAFLPVTMALSKKR